MINAHIGLTYKCNMNCVHCYANKQEKQIESITTNSFNELLNKLEKLGTFYITYTMGEPLLFNNFFECAKMAKDRHFYQILLSNGSTIQDENVIQKLVSCGIKRVGISLDSANPQKHDSNRRYDGAYAKAVSAIRLLCKSNEIQTQILTTISNNNLTEIEPIIELGKKLGVKEYSFLWQRDNGILSPISNLSLYTEKMTFLINEAEKGEISIKIHDPRVDAIVKKLHKNKSISTKTYEDFLNMNVCHAFDELLLIDPAGNVFACNFCPDPFCNIYESDLKDVISFIKGNGYYCLGK